MKTFHTLLFEDAPREIKNNSNRVVADEEEEDLSEEQIQERFRKIHAKDSSEIPTTEDEEKNEELDYEEIANSYEP